MSYALTTTMPNIIRMIRYKQYHLKAKWWRQDGSVYCVSEEVNNVRTFILSVLGLKSEADFINFLGNEFIKYMQSAKGKYEVSNDLDISISVPRRGFNIDYWRVSSIDMGNRIIYIEDDEGKKHRYTIPRDISLDSSEKLDDLPAFWSPVIKAVAIAFFLVNPKGKAMLMNKLNDKLKDKVVYDLSSAISGIEIVSNNMTINGDLFFQSSLAYLNDIYLPFIIVGDKYQEFLGYNNMSGINLYQATHYYNPTSKVAFIDTGNKRVVVQVVVSAGGGIKVLLGGQTWIGITKIKFGTETRFGFAIYADLDNEVDSDVEESGFSGDIIRYLLKRFGLLKS